jgi:hypothetical protein
MNCSTTSRISRLKNTWNRAMKGLREAADIPCPALLKRDNVFYCVREGDPFGDVKFLQSKAFLPSKLPLR